MVVSYGVQYRRCCTVPGEVRSRLESLEGPRRRGGYASLESPRAVRAQLKPAALVAGCLFLRQPWKACCWASVAAGDSTGRTRSVG